MSTTTHGGGDFDLFLKIKFILNVVGDKHPSININTIHKLINEYNLFDRVKILGFKDEYELLKMKLQEIKSVKHWLSV